MRLEGKVAVVTGASTGLGRAIAQRFAAEGAYVLVSDLRGAPINSVGGKDSTIDTIDAAGGDGVFIQADVAKTDEVGRIVEAALEHSGRIDIAVNSAAVFDSWNIVETTEEAWDKLLDVNLRAQFVLCKAFITQMMEQEQVDEVRGRIVNLSSQHGMVGPPNHCAYGVSKAGVIQLTRQLAVDYGKHGIIVNSVAPGRIVTGRHAGEQAYLESGTVDADLAYSFSRTPFHRLGRAEDVAGAVLFLSSDDCTFVSGHTLLVDGGWMAY